MDYLYCEVIHGVECEVQDGYYTFSLDNGAEYTVEGYAAAEQIISQHKHKSISEFDRFDRMNYRGWTRY